MMNRPAIEQLSAAVSRVLPAGLSEDIKQNIKASLLASFDRLGLVTREELDIQKQVLERTCQQLHLMEQNLGKLEQSLLKKS